MKSLDKTAPRDLTEVIPMSIKMARGQHIFITREAKKRGLRVRDFLIKAVKQFIKHEKETI